jgi:hypothetical protein
MAKSAGSKPSNLLSFSEYSNVQAEYSDQREIIEHSHRAARTVDIPLGTKYTVQSAPSPRPKLGPPPPLPQASVSPPEPKGRDTLARG